MRLVHKRITGRLGSWDLQSALGVNVEFNQRAVGLPALPLQ